MKVFTDPIKLQKWCAARRQKGAKIALVPTMGYLHEGHLSLIKTARRHRATEIVVSVFVNPIQFGVNEDFGAYPRDFAADAAKCRKAGVTAIFHPDAASMYADNRSIAILENQLSQGLCGARRPGHFSGVCTVVAKLFNIVHPHFAVFGQKDFQQQAIIRRMVRDLNFDLEIITAPIVREPSGLARSSRNTYLCDDEKARAVVLSQTLLLARQEVNKTGGAMWRILQKKLVKNVEKAGLKVDYIEAVTADTLEGVKRLVPGNVVLIAAFCGKTRLIDNIII